MACPFLVDDPRTKELFPEDAIARAKKLLASFKGGVGAYTDSRGNPLIRDEVAEFIARRDGYKPPSEVGTKAAVMNEGAWIIT